MASNSTATQTDEHVSLKLLLNEKGNKVLFAEAGKDFVDILCSFLTMPLGTVARLVEMKSSIGPVTVGCLNSLYQSVADLDESCFCNDTIKQMLLQPINSAEDYCNTLKLNIDDTQPTKYFACANFKNCSYRDLTTSTYKDKHKCCCNHSFTCQVFLKQSHQGFVNCVTTFVITDDLTVMPNGIDYTSLSLLQEYGITNPSSVKEIVLNVTKEKVVDLLKHSLLSSSTLTDLFLRKKPSPGRSMFFFPDGESSCKIKITVKLVIRKSDGKLLYAQGEQDFANMLLNFLTFPLGIIAQKFGKICSVGNINRLYKSIADLNEYKYFMSINAKFRLACPCIDSVLTLSKQILTVVDPDYINTPVQFLIHGGDKRIFEGKIKKMSIATLGSCNDGYVKGPNMYVVTDDLVVAPLSPISSLCLLNRLKTPLTDLKEKVVVIGFKECLCILMASLTSSSALTNGLAHLLTEVKEEK
ncbi:uncharacterized protein LOC131641762 [Vicia villosa]|uniref:uncharacterized protein LOC131641762 n=1 Tax=Vicia villosa TaxID=3911 RepID=UPI00273C8FE1|nr:uncharacterized protein LOC131641762 [Vicia villosa]